VLELLQNDGGGGDEEMKNFTQFSLLHKWMDLWSSNACEWEIQQFDVAAADEDMKISPKI
jgi:hypothetical protein